MWIRNYNAKDEFPQALTVDEHQLLAEFLQHEHLQDAVAFSGSVVSVSKSLKKLMESFALDVISFNAMKKFRNERPELVNLLSLGTFKELFPLNGFSMVCLLHV